MMIHVNPIATNGEITIGYDANGVAGAWDGDMAETCESDEFLVANYYDEFPIEFESSEESFDLHKTDSGELVWRDGSYNLTPIRDVLKKFGDM